MRMKESNWLYRCKAIYMFNSFISSQETIHLAWFGFNPMASVQCQSQSEQTTVWQKTTATEACHTVNSEHSFTNKVKEMATSACKIFTDHHGQNGHPAYNTHNGLAETHSSVNHGSCQVQQSTDYHGSNITDHSHAHATATTETKKEGNLVANIGEHIKNMKKKWGKKAGKCKDDSSDSDSSSSDESDDDNRGKKN